jgi:hypothetical protein
MIAPVGNKGVRSMIEERTLEDHEMELVTGGLCDTAKTALLITLVAGAFPLTVPVGAVAGIVYLVTKNQT